MELTAFSSDAAGVCRKTLEGYSAFFPNALPPRLEIDWDLAGLLSEADQALSELAGAGELLLNPHILIRPYIRREAILSSRIENTIADMEELLLFEVEEEEKKPDVREVSNYVHAMESGLAKVREMPVCLRLIRELHGTLMGGVRGGESPKRPGEFRESQNWIGKPGATLKEATFVPPPPDAMMDALSDWERYLHADSAEPILIKLAILHYQFEAIHPFIDGNGRIGRLLITLSLCETRRLREPLLYLSGFFDETRDDYYRLLLAVSQKGDWRSWIEYFLRGVREQSRVALADTRAILTLYQECQEKLKAANRIPKAAPGVLDAVFESPLFSISRYSKRTGENYPTVTKAVEFWEKNGLLREATGQRRNRLYVAAQLLGTKPFRDQKKNPNPETTHADA